MRSFGGAFKKNDINRIIDLGEHDCVESVALIGTLIVVNLPLVNELANQVTQISLDLEVQIDRL